MTLVDPLVVPLVASLAKFGHHAPATWFIVIVYVLTSIRDEYVRQRPLQYYQDDSWFLLARIVAGLAEFAAWTFFWTAWMLAGTPFLPFLVGLVFVGGDVDADMETRLAVWATAVLLWT